MAHCYAVIRVLLCMDAKSRTLLRWMGVCSSCNLGRRGTLVGEVCFCSWQTTNTVNVCWDCVLFVSSCQAANTANVHADCVDFISSFHRGNVCYHLNTFCTFPPRQEKQVETWNSLDLILFRLCTHCLQLFLFLSFSLQIAELWQAQDHIAIMSDESANPDPQVGGDIMEADSASTQGGKQVRMRRHWCYPLRMPRSYGLGSAKQTATDKHVYKNTDDEQPTMETNTVCCVRTMLASTLEM